MTAPAAGLPTEDLSASVRSNNTEVSFTALPSNNLGRRTFATVMGLLEYAQSTLVPNGDSIALAHGLDVTQRPLNPAHALDLAAYLGRAIMGDLASAEENAEILLSTTARARVRAISNEMAQPAFAWPSVTVVLRNGGRSAPIPDPGNGSTMASRIFLPRNERLLVLDGQHRRAAILRVYEQLRHAQTYQRTPPDFVMSTLADLELDHVLDEIITAMLDRLSSMTTVAEVHLHLNSEQARQIFVDSMKLRPAEKNLRIELDRSQPYHVVLLDEVIPHCITIAANRRQRGVGKLEIKDVVAISARLTYSRPSLATVKVHQQNVRKGYIRAFWEALSRVPGWRADDVDPTNVLSNPVVLHALARGLYDLRWSRNPAPDGDAKYAKVLRALPFYDWSGANPIWTTTVASNGVACGALGDDGEVRFLAQINEVVAPLGTALMTALLEVEVPAAA